MGTVSLWGDFDCDCIKYIKEKGIYECSQDDEVKEVTYDNCKFCSNGYIDQLFFNGE